jgi:hypothetical protein
MSFFAVIADNKIVSISRTHPTDLPANQFGIPIEESLYRTLSTDVRQLLSAIVIGSPPDCRISLGFTIGLKLGLSQPLEPTSVVSNSTIIVDFTNPPQEFLWFICNKGQPLQCLTSSETIRNLPLKTKAKYKKGLGTKYDIYSTAEFTFYALA